MRTQLDKLIEGNGESELLHRMAYAKNIAIGFANWIESSSPYFGSLDDGEWQSHNDSFNNEDKRYTTEQLFNEYLNTLK
jgi:hypothetical protein